MAHCRSRPLQPTVAPQQLAEDFAERSAIVLHPDGVPLGDGNMCWLWVGTKCSCRDKKDMCAAIERDNSINMLCVHSHAVKYIDCDKCTTTKTTTVTRRCQSCFCHSKQSNRQVLEDVGSRSNMYIATHLRSRCGDAEKKTDSENAFIVKVID